MTRCPVKVLSLREGARRPADPERPYSLVLRTGADYLGLFISGSVETEAVGPSRILGAPGTSAFLGIV